MRKSVIVGRGDYRKLIEDNGYYVDKTLLIEEVLDYNSEVTLITRPRRFGKTLNMTMIREFFDITVDSKAIFEGMNIMSTKYASRINTVPVVYLTFKNCEGSDKEELLADIQDVIRKEYDRFYNFFNKDIDKIKSTTLARFNEIYDVLVNCDVDTNFRKVSNNIKKSLVALTDAINEYYGIKSIVIIDEYDAPFIEAKTRGYYEDVRTTLSGLFGSTFKENTSIERGIMTGIQRIAQESIFSKFNNPDICTVVDEKYHDKFGLTTEETKEYLEYFGYELDDEVRNYYDGYRFYKEDVYNPMSITAYISNKGKLKSYWLNTSSNQLIKEVIPKAHKAFKNQFEKLIENGIADVRIDFMTTFQEKSNVKSLWGLLVNAGYVTVDSEVAKGKYRVRIPNNEVNTAFEEIVALYMDVEETTLAELFDALLDEDMEEFESKYQDILLENTSYHDASQKENSYHMLMLGMCVYLKDRYHIKSNIESGKGRSDIILYPKFEGDMNIIIEFKNEENITLEKSSDNALDQIEDEKYYAGMKGDVLMIGIAHRNKECMVKHKIIQI